MNTTLAQRQQAYARLLLQEGLNVQKGQLLAIDCPVDQAWFARLCAAAAYDMGCREVVMNWNDDALTRESICARRMKYSIPCILGRRIF